MNLAARVTTLIYKFDFKGKKINASFVIFERHYSDNHVRETSRCPTWVFQVANTYCIYW